MKNTDVQPDFSDSNSGIFETVQDNSADNKEDVVIKSVSDGYSEGRLYEMIESFN